MGAGSAWAATAPGNQLPPVAEPRITDGGSLVGGAGDDIHASGGTDIVNGGAGDDILYGYDGNAPSMPAPAMTP